MKFTKILTCLLTVCSLGFADQNNYYSPYQDDCCFSGFVVGADFLYWKPCVDDLDFAAELTNGSTTDDLILQDFKYHSICPSWEPGFRVYAVKENVLCGWNLGASFTWLKSDDRANIDNNSLSLYPTLTAPEFMGGTLPFNIASANWESKYYAWDILLAYSLNWCCLEFAPFFGVSGIYLTQEYQTAFINNINVLPNLISAVGTDWDSSYWGVGLKFGSSLDYQFCNCFSFFALGSFELLTGRADNDNHLSAIRTTGTTPPEITILRNFEDDECCLLVPGYHIALGLRYASCICDVDYGIRLGYEFLQYHNIPNPRVFISDQLAGFAISTSPSTRTYGYHGLFAGVDVAF